MTVQDRVFECFKAYYPQPMTAPMVTAATGINGSSVRRAVAMLWSRGLIASQPRTNNNPNVATSYRATLSPVGVQPVTSITGADVAQA